MSTRALIVEDEPLARENLRDFLADVDWIECVGEAADGLTAVRLLDELLPDLVFLDVKMPELSGIEVLERARHRPAVVFTTAFASHAVAAFELGAIDYLTKPFGRERFLRSMERVRGRLASGEGALERARDALDGKAPLSRIFVRRRDELIPVRMEDVVRIEAQGDYAELHVGGVSHLVRVSLSEILSRLDPRSFLRVHRSHVVNLGRVRSLRVHDERRLAVLLDDGSEVVASRAGTQELKDLSL